MNSIADNQPDSSAAQPGKPAGLLSGILWGAVSLALGLAGGVFLHYLIYRLSLPTEPFIYVSF